MTEYNPEHSNLALSALHLLEFVLASYEDLTGIKSARKIDLNRHEKIIEEMLVRSGATIREFLPWALKSQRQEFPSTAIIVRYMELGDSPKDAANRFFLVHRHNNKAAHRE